MSGYNRLPYNEGDITNPRHRKLWFRRDIIYVGLSTSILSTLLGLSIGRHTRSSSQHSTSPLIDTTPSVFIYNKTFAEAPSLDTNAAWASLIPSGRGFITVDPSGEPLLYEDGRQLDLPSTRVVSVFHQLHCLDELRIGYYALSTPNTHGDSAGSQQHHHAPAHMKHCFDYLRQALMCAADMTLEPLRPPQEGKMPGVNGWDVQHTCRDWENVRSWTAKRRATEESGIE